MSEQAVEVEDLHYRFNEATPEVLIGALVLGIVKTCLPRDPGKSTLLQLLAGKRLTRSSAKVLGQDVFFSTPPGVTYLGTEWAMNSVVRSDLGVAHFLDSVGGWRHKERRDMLLEILDVDLEWRMHQVSDGERRRVQIVQGLMAPWQILLLDEVTVDLDVLVRSRLLTFLRQETEQRHATIIYATHIFDGLDAFPTHICHLQLGSTTTAKPLRWPLSTDKTAVDDVPASVRQKMDDPDRAGSRLLELALHWLGQDRLVRDESPQARRRGPQASTVPSDSEQFFRKYDYGHH